MTKKTSKNRHKVEKSDKKDKTITKMVYSTTDPIMSGLYSSTPDIWSAIQAPVDQ